MPFDLRKACFCVVICALLRYDMPSFVIYMQAYPLSGIMRFRQLIILMSVGESTFTVNAACLCHLKSVKWLFEVNQNQKGEE